MIAKLKGSLTAKIFLITCILMMLACVFTYAFIALVMPRTYTADRNQALSEQAEHLTQQLAQSTLEDCDALLTQFATDYDAEVSIIDADGKSVKNTVMGDLQTLENGPQWTVSVDGIQAEADIRLSDLETVESVDVIQAIGLSFSFSSSSEVYQLMVTGNMKAVNQAMEALERIWPWLIGAILIISILSSVFYARSITKPIVRISGIAQKMSTLDFSWQCKENRTDEIGILAHSLNELVERLSATMAELQTANATLKADIDKERELERQRMEFFSAVSHELKTPITVIKGQLSGMLDGVGTYADRDKYLARSLIVARQMENLVQELLTIARMEKIDPTLQEERVDLTEIIRGCAGEYTDLFEQKDQCLCVKLSDALWISGDRILLIKAIQNVLVNAAIYSPDGAKICVSAYKQHNDTLVTIENTGVHIPKETVPHLFEAFYRVDQSRNRQTGGSGLGLYLVKTILDKHSAVCEIANTEAGVCVTMRFST